MWIPRTCLIAIIVFTAHSVFAEEVAYTKEGRFFFPPGCEAFKGQETRTTSIEDAIERGMRPSEDCYPADLIAAKLQKREEVLSTLDLRARDLGVAVAEETPAKHRRP